jgi:hypothetical protein
MSMSIELGLRPELVEALEQRLPELPTRRRGAVAWYAAAVSVVASCHGLPDGRSAMPSSNASWTADPVAT